MCFKLFKHLMNCVNDVPNDTLVPQIRLRGLKRAEEQRGRERRQHRFPQLEGEDLRRQQEVKHQRQVRLLEKTKYLIYRHNLIPS